MEWRARRRRQLTTTIPMANQRSEGRSPMVEIERAPPTNIQSWRIIVEDVGQPPEDTVDMLDSCCRIRVLSPRTGGGKMQQAKLGTNRLTA
jgi:hypothetical protein